MQIKVLFYLVAVWESESLFEYKCSRLVLKDVRDGDNLRDSKRLSLTSFKTNLEHLYSNRLSDSHTATR